jgi:hypothetical protein
MTSKIVAANDAEASTSGVAATMSTSHNDIIDISGDEEDI